MRITSKHFIVVLGAFNFFFLPAAFGEDIEPSVIGKSKGSTRDSTTLEVMTVTAQKREENVQNVPMSITAFSGAQIEDADIGNIQELTLQSPNIFMKQGASTNVIIIRGISNDADFIHSTTGLYVDDINYSLNYMHNPSLFDIERIEVLRGPQGTLYGRNSESGVINIVTRQPGNQFYGKAYGEISAYDPDQGTSFGYRTGLSFSGPIIEDQLFIGIAGEIETSDGYIKNIFTGNDEAGDTDKKNGRITTRWTPRDNLEFGLTLDALDTDSGNGNVRYLEGPWKTGPHQISYDTDNNSIEENGDGQALKIKYWGEDVTLLSITGRRFYENRMLRDSLGTSVPDGVNDLTYSSDLISQELRVSSADEDSHFDWLGGIYVSSEDNVTDIDMPSLKEIRNTDMETQEYAVFGQGTLTFFDKLHLTAGLRYSVDDMEGVMDYYGSSDSYTFGASFDDDVLLPKFSIAYDLTPEIMTYFTVSRGYNAGGFNTAYALDSQKFTYGPEFTWNYEIGAKSAFMGNRIFLNLALFYIAIDDKQVPELDGITDIMHVRNAAEAHSEGFEVELQARLLDGLDVFAGIGYANVEFDEWTTSGFDYAGKKLPNAPEFTANIGVQYRHLSGFFGRTDLLMTDDYYSDAFNSQKIDGRTIVNLRMGYESESWDAILWCKNLFYEEYQTVGFARRFDRAVDGAPRMFGATFTKYF